MIQGAPWIDVYLHSETITPINSQGAAQFSDNRAKNEVINDLSNEC